MLENNYFIFSSKELKTILTTDQYGNLKIDIPGYLYEHIRSKYAAYYEDAEKYDGFLFTTYSIRNGYVVEGYTKFKLSIGIITDIVINVHDVKYKDKANSNIHSIINKLTVVNGEFYKLDADVVRIRSKAEPVTLDEQVFENRKAVVENRYFKIGLYKSDWYSFEPGIEALLTFNDVTTDYTKNHLMFSGEYDDDLVNALIKMLNLNYSIFWNYVHSEFNFK